ncbi:MAG TPA: MBL fold metallo-hydrolase [Candidatus Omnitrophota bacterium]|nr:MBL fold metallo-hydrolase [Candidatus Omnitrophota bacterium]
MLNFFPRDLWRGVLRFLTGGILWAVFAAFSFAQEDPALSVHFIDVGYGDAILIELPDRRAVLIDAGEQKYAAQLNQYLASRNIKNLAAAILTHPHKNHFGGFLSVVKKYPVAKFYTNGDSTPDDKSYADLLSEIEKRRIPAVALREGDEIFLGNKETRLVVLHPSGLTGSTNEDSLVLWLVFKNTSFLLPSDIQQRQQDGLLERYPEAKKANAILVPHHGGRITGRFASAFGEEAVFVVSTGANEYGKPFFEGWDKLKGEIFRTDLDGSIVLKSNGQEVEVSYGRYKK